MLQVIPRVSRRTYIALLVAVLSLVDSILSWEVKGGGGEKEPGNGAIAKMPHCLDVLVLFV